LLGTTASRLGEQATVRALTLHRESYITEHDFVRMAQQGVQYVRLAVGWWVFASDPTTIVDPSTVLLSGHTRRGHPRGMEELLDPNAC
jgi:hypothetical protein